MKMRKMQFFVLLLTGITGLGIIGIYAASLTAPRPKNLGVKDGRLAPIAKSPNSVSTQTDSKHHQMQPLSFSDNSGAVIATLKNIVESQAGATVVEADDRYLYAEFRSTIFRFVDDVEFWVDVKDNVVHFRSASRVGHSDFGVNRERMEVIGQQFSQRRRETTP